MKYFSSQKQYRFIHQCLADKNNKSTKVSQNELSNKIQEMLVKKNGKTTFELQFEVYLKII